ncbi:MAG TPA: 3-hydroxyacyl-CoA dehydrogenase family protein [Candidatus Microbacterium pullistercoris]|nr:3-hydroxyacyl-CoA dehydrogenase family protein [Candidatus Microbacterium pullistercoris]
MTRIGTAVVCGAGAMGSQIAMLTALAGCATTMVDVDQPRLDSAITYLKRRCARAVAKGILDADAVDAAFARLETSLDLDAAAGEADIVIEAIIEDLDAKRELFQRLARVTRADTILATNSSSIVSSKLADLANPERVCNMHFFNPALVMKLVEVVGGEHTSPATVDAVVDLANRMDKTPVVVRKEIFGFIANRIVAAIFDEAIALLEAGVATVEDIDRAVTNGLGHPVGPFALLDMTGIDVNVAIKRLEARATGDPSRGPSRTLLDLEDAGRLGRKSGRGFYEYGAS